MSELNQYPNQEINEEYKDDERMMAMLVYLLSFFTTIIGPLIIWLLKKDESRLVDKAGKNYFNMVISYFIWFTVLTIAFFILMFGFMVNEPTVNIVVSIIVFLIAIISVVLSICYLIFHIIACVKYFKGESYLVPLSIRFFK